jgi:hypothetical protein
LSIYFWLGFVFRLMCCLTREVTIASTGFRPWRRSWKCLAMRSLRPTGMTRGTNFTFFFSYRRVFVFCLLPIFSLPSLLSSKFLFSLAGLVWCLVMRRAVTVAQCQCSHRLIRPGHRTTWGVD